MRRIFKRASLSGLVAVALVLLAAQSASAVTLAAADPSGPFGWLSVEDSRGVGVHKYMSLPIDSGGITSPTKAVWAVLIGLMWGGHILSTIFGIFINNLVLGFGWLDPIASVLEGIADAFDQLVSNLGVGVLFMTVTAFVAFCWVMKGRWATAVWEILMVSVIAVVAAGLLANPLNSIAGPDGLLQKANETGLEISRALEFDSTAAESPDDLRTAQNARMVDTFVAVPAQMVAFGKPLSGECAEVMAEKMRAGDNADDVRDAVKDCDKEAGEWAGDPGPVHFITVFALMPSTAALMIVLVMLAGSVFAASLWALWVGIKLIWATLQALLPGSARGPFFLALADLVVSAVTVALASTMLGGYLLVVQALFTNRSEAGWPPMATFVLADVLLFGLVYLWWRQRKALKRANRKIAEAFSWRPGASATKIPAAGPSWRDMNLGQVAHMGSAASNYLTFRRAGRHLESSGNATQGEPAPAETSAAATAPGDSGSTPAAAVAAAATRKALPRGGNGPDSEGSPEQRAAAGKSQGQEDKPASRKLLGAARHAAAAAATGGTSAAAQAVGSQAAQAGLQKAATARRAEVESKLNAGQASSGAPSHGAGGGSSAPRPTHPRPTPSTAHHRPRPNLSSGPKWKRVVSDGQVVFVRADEGERQ